MKGKRRLHHESLESRRLLAANCELPSTPLESAETPPPLQLATEAESEGMDSGEIGRDILRPISLFQNLSYGPDLVQEAGSRLFVVDQQPYAFEGGSLFVFERGDDGSLETVAQVELEFPVERMIVNGDQALLFGNNFNWFVVADHTADGGPRYSASVRDAGEGDDRADDIALPEIPKTVAVTVNLGAEVEVIRQEFEGLYHRIHHEGDRIAIVSSIGGDATIAIYPPPLVTGLLTTFDITADGLRKVASSEIPLFGFTSIHERDFYSARTDHNEIVYLTPTDASVEGDVSPFEGIDAAGIRAPDDSDMPPIPTSSLTRYSLGDDAITEVAKVELGPGFLMHFEVAPDGQTAVAVRSEFNGAGPVTVVDLINLSGDVPVIESIELTEFNGQVMVGGPDYVVLRSYRDNTLVVIDANQSIDPAVENRVRRIEIPARLNVHHEFLQVSADRLVLRAERSRVSGDDGIDASVVTDAPPDSILLTISISEAKIIGDTHLPEQLAFLHDGMFLIDAETERFGLIVHGTTSTSDGPQFLFGRLGENGEFERDGLIKVGRWLEVDANADRLIARESDRVLEYDWENPEDPVVTPLGEPDSTIKAVNDEYILRSSSEDHLLDVLANDVIHRFDFGQPARIVELAGAPEGAEIVDGHMIRIPGAALVSGQDLRFEYVISNGEQRSSAVVEIDVQLISEERVRDLVDAIRRRAADDFNVSVDDVEIKFVEKVFTEPLPIVLPDHQGELDLSPGILVTLSVPNGSALYAASLEGEIILVFGSQPESLVELGLRAVDAEGNPLETVAEGDNFWLELTAKDLRDFGLGVYAAFFDLLVPTEHLVITGPVEYGPGFTSIPGSSFDEGEIDDVGAIGNEIDPPGNQLQQVLTIAVRAVGAGEITLQPEPADARGTETLLRGRETEVPISRVVYTPLQLNIVEAPAGDPLDADGNGEVSATDALAVINFLGRFGTTALDDLAATVLGIHAEGEAMSQQDIDAMRRLDTTKNGVISSLDALVVINGIQRQALANEMDAEAEDDDALNIDPAAPIDGLAGNQLF